MADEMDTPKTASMRQTGVCNSVELGSSIMKCRTIGIDLAKSVFQVCGVNQYFKPLFNKKLARRDFIAFMAQQPPTLVVMEACYSSHY